MTWGDTSPCNVFPTRGSGLVELGVMFLHLLAPRLCQQKQMHAGFLRRRPLSGRGRARPSRRRIHGPFARS